MREVFAVNYGPSSVSEPEHRPGHTLQYLPRSQLRSRVHPIIEMFLRNANCDADVEAAINSRRNIGCILQLFEIPTEMFARDSKSGLFAVESVQRFEMREDDITHFGEWKVRAQIFPCDKKTIDITKDPW